MKKLIAGFITVLVVLAPIRVPAQTASWTDNSGGVANTDLYRAPSSATTGCPAIDPASTVHPQPGYTKVATVPPTVTTAKDATAITQLKRYCYYVVASGAVDGAPAGTIVSSPGSTIVPFDVPPKAPTLIRVVLAAIQSWWLALIRR